MGQDITERNQARAALEAERALLARRVEERTADLSAANVELARAAQLKDEFLASMSHELRTPLNAILGMSEALQDQVYGPFNERQSKALHSIEASGRHLLALISDILDVAKIGAGKLDLAISTVAVESICQASLQLIKQSAKKKSLKISSAFDSKVTTLHTDARRLKQILVNLLSNAVKFTPDGGEIGLEVVGDPLREVINFIIWDTGIGISSEGMARLFQPFVQLDSSLTRRYSGTGLGLSLVYRMVELMRGNVAVESAIGVGSRFTVSLPWIRSETNRSGRKSESDRVELTNVPMLRHILIIDDSLPTINQLTRYLGDLAIKTTVLSGNEAMVSHIASVRPDLIVLDVVLPPPSGWEILAQLKATPETKTIPVLIYSEIDEQARGLALGAAAYLLKPAARQKLYETLAQIFEPPSSSSPDVQV
jgi:signal transduction histidine kinase/CheY-like chemotaxis protein